MWINSKLRKGINRLEHNLIYMYKVIARLDKQNRITIPQVVRELIGVGPEDVIEVDVIGKVEKTKNEKSQSENPLEALSPALEPVLA